MTTISSSTPIAPKAVPVSGGGAVDETVKGWVDALNDDTGAVSSTEKANALASIQKSWSTLSGANEATKSYVNAGLSSSSFLSKANILGNAMSAQIGEFTNSAKATGPKSSAVFQKMLDGFDKLSAGDKIAFAASTGVNPDDWRATTQARLKLANLFETAQSAGELGADGKATGKATAALKALIAMSDQFDRLDKTDTAAVNAWTHQVGALLDGPGHAPAVRIDLSDEAKAYLAAKGS
jgi:hypothetical protein